MAVAIIAGKRTAFTKMGTALRHASAIDLGVSPVNALVSQFNLQTNPHGLLTFGSTLHHADVSNLSREIALESHLHPQTRAFSCVMACATSLLTVHQASQWIKNGLVPWAIAGGCDSTSDIPISFNKRVSQILGDLNAAKTTFNKIKHIARLRPSDWVPKIPAVAERSTGLSMGRHCEKMMADWKIPREEQDAWAVMSQKRAAQSQDFYQPFLCQTRHAEQASKDNLIRPDTSLEKIARLPPVFDKQGTLTAANSSPMTDGGAAVLLADKDYAQKQGWPILAWIDDVELAAIDIYKEGLLMAPSYAILRLLKRQKQNLTDFDIIEIHEAFAAQVLANLKALKDERWAQQQAGCPPTLVPTYDRINPHGGSIALGHPFGATGARLVMQLAQELFDAQAKQGLISVCAAGGLGMVMSLRR